MGSARERNRGAVDAGGAPAGPGRRRAVRPVAVLLAATLASGAAALDALPDTEHLQWRGELSQRTLADGSVLNRYVTRSAAADEADASLVIGFVPRFDCSPLIGVRLVGALADEAGDSLADGDRVTLAIDGEGVPMPVVVDAADAATTLWLDEPADSRARVRQRFDTGSRAELSLPGDTSMTFSLLGSRLSAAGTEAACLAHEPLPYED